jgi:putative Mg2+ transporter-C (MgtC) family protein
MTLDTTDIAFRLLAAVAVGAAFGINRDLRGKPTGMRTLGLVSLGSAVITIGAMQSVPDDVGALSRVLQGAIQGVLTGVGFVGAGAVLRRPQAGEVHGLTTAAIVWTTAALGVACAIAAWPLAALGLALALALVVLLYPLERWLERIGRARKEPDPRTEPK